MLQAGVTETHTILSTVSPKRFDKMGTCETSVLGVNSGPSVLHTILILTDHEHHSLQGISGFERCNPDCSVHLSGG